MHSKKVLFILIACLFCMASLGWANGSQEAVNNTQSSDAQPEFIRWATYDISSSAYMQSTGVAEGILKSFGTKIRAIPLGNDVARTLSCKMGNTDFFFSGAAVSYAGAGIYDFSTREWGPQRIRMVWLVPRDSTSSIATQANSGIKKIEDLKGKKVAYIIGSPAPNGIVEGSLNLVGLGWDDVKKIEFPSITASYQALRDGKIDCCMLNTTSPVAYEMEASPSGLYWISHPTYEENKSGWDDFPSYYAGTYSALIKKGAGLSADSPIRMVAFPYPAVFTYEETSEDLVYWQTRMIAESFDNFKDIFDDAASWSIEKVKDLPAAYAPWHKGAIRYFRETGIWTEEKQLEYEKQLEKENKLISLWDSVCDEAISDNISDKKFSEYWLNKRTEAGF